MKLGFLIVNWNGGVELANAIASVTEQANEIVDLDWQGVVWDNNSSDGSTQSLQIGSHRWHLERATANLGFAKGNNLANEKLQNCDWIFMLNPDVHLAGNALAALLSAINSQQEAIAIGPILKAWPNTELLDGLGDVVHMSGFAWRDGFGNAALSMQYLRNDYETFAVSGAALLIQRDVFKKLGGFDDDFFCYQEDVDLGFRLRLMGYRAIQVPSAVVYHVGSQSTGGHRSDFSVYHGRRNLVWCYVKNMPGILFWLCLPLHLALNVVELIYFTFQGQGRVIWRAKWDAIKGIPKMWRKRRQIQAQRVVTVGEIWRALDKRLWPWGFKSIRAKSGRRFGKD